MIHATISPDTSTDTRRREPRVEVTTPVTMRELGSEAVDARLLNISAHGFMAETEADIAAGARVWLALPGLPRVNALVKWTRGGRLGGEFAEPINVLDVFHAVGLELTRQANT